MCKAIESFKEEPAINHQPKTSSPQNLDINIKLSKIKQISSDQLERKRTVIKPKTKSIQFLKIINKKKDIEVLTSSK